jgi:hypothetical protein
MSLTHNSTSNFDAFAFMLGQLDAQRVRVELQATEPPKLPPGRPPKVVIPVTPGAVRYEKVDKDRDEAIDEMEQLEFKLQYNRLKNCSSLDTKTIIEKLIEGTGYSYATIYNIVEH